MDLNSVNFTTIPGIVAASFFLTELIKRYVTSSTPIIGKIPVALVPLILCGILTFVANKLMRHPDGMPYLTGDTWSLVGGSILSAAGSSGIYTWIKSGGQTVGESQPISGGNPSSEDRTMKPN